MLIGTWKRFVIFLLTLDKIMASTFHGTLSGQNKPGARVKYNQDGTISGAASFSYAKGSLSADVIPLGTPHPWDSAAFVSDREAVWDESEGTLNCEYMGVWSSTVQKVECFASAEVAPIETSDNFSFGVSPDNVVYDDSGLFVGFKPGATSTSGFPIGGVQSFYAPSGLTVRITYSSLDGETAITALGSMGQVQSSLTAGSVTLSGSDTILCTSVNWEETYMDSVSVFRITEEFIYNPNGWNPDIYN